MSITKKIIFWGVLVCLFGAHQPLNAALRVENGGDIHFNDRDNRDDIFNEYCKYLESAERSIVMSHFYLTNQQVINTLIMQLYADVAITIYLDKRSFERKTTKDDDPTMFESMKLLMKLVHKDKLTIYVMDLGSYLNHNKLTLIDYDPNDPEEDPEKKIPFLTLTGSLNLSVNARNHEENFLSTNSHVIARKTFDKLKSLEKRSYCVKVNEYHFGSKTPQRIFRAIEDYKQCCMGRYKKRTLTEAFDPSEEGEEGIRVKKRKLYPELLELAATINRVEDNDNLSRSVEYRRPILATAIPTDPCATRVVTRSMSRIMSRTSVS